ncbi:MarR family transcriptional regulator [Shimia sp. R10_1]|uniref:MarR family winged helix-turn-helix transcriptional regulator n=1 Tax=Shimia sp. R10_1 TaxID=2821095 RepID=UPI001ADC5B92|nr:MarR family transcriptional regulator [Shimia sp. R10_1]MBO9474452.1 MarR family transcriptional regulator [Shimia sp. R10_1]
MARQPRLFFLINKAYAALARASERKTQAMAGLSMPQHGVLALLSKEDGQTVTDLAKALSMRKSSLSGLIDRMVERGFVRRAREDADGRVVRVYLEPSAQDLLQRTLPLVQHINGLLLAPFDAAEQEVIGRFLTHMAENAEEIIDQVELSEERA